MQSFQVSLFLDCTYYLRYVVYVKGYINHQLVDYNCLLCIVYYVSLHIMVFTMIYHHHHHHKLYIRTHLLLQTNWSNLSYDI